MLRLFDVKMLEDPDWCAVNEEIAEIVAQGPATQFGHYDFDYPFVALALRELSPGCQVLDIGALSGAIQVYMARRVGRLVAVDRAVEQARTFNRDINAAYGTKIEFRDAADLTEDDESFDALYAASSLEHNRFSTQRDTVARYARLLKPGGLFVATVVASLQPPGKPITYEIVKVPRNALDCVCFSADDLVETWTDGTGLQLLDDTSNYHPPVKLWRTFRERYDYAYMPLGIILRKVDS